MSITICIILVLIAALMGTIAIGSIILSAEHKRNKKEEAKIKQQGAENAQHTADIIAEANKIKENANTGNNSNDLHTMANQLHDYAHRK